MCIGFYYIRTVDPMNGCDDEFSLQIKNPLEVHVDLHSTFKGLL